ncbi:MAG: cation:proton antiporter [Alphaproteobacteria bacterium]|jgi:CPA2 family monovalent cation:H+ antiporter-2|nr:cation:proton antiporter [Alphaproteobacteria bacterium]MCB1550476.1 cation:proton antiporter [Alphaproteobacteria bacterium]MCB9985971.1 cation:proton antiporter [Micavibrio sp.]HRK96874.1 cation:proton antiporter [Alphaproteobacteria bacterium]
MTEHEMPLITTLSFGLIMAFMLGLVAVRLRLPPIVGYLLAGVVIGPYSPGYVADVGIANQLSEIGIVLLMFGVGLHFSFKDLLEVKKIAITGAFAQIAISVAIGMGLAHLWGWRPETGFVFGLACSVASTVVMMRAMEDNHLLQTTIGKISVGWLVVQDLVMVLALVLIPSLATTGDDTEIHLEMLIGGAVAMAKMALFIVVMMLLGYKTLPAVLHQVAATRSRELFTLAVLAVAVGVAFAAGMIFGVSLALGAFIAGMMLKESSLSKDIAERALPLQDAFAVLFFVAVGMLFNPAILWENPSAVFLCVLTIMVGKSLASFFIVAVFKYPLKTGLMVTAGLGQIGEFSFILATLALSLGIFDAQVNDILLAGAIISISLNPLTFLCSNILNKYISARPEWARMFAMPDDDALAHLSPDEAPIIRSLVILVGAGSIGGYICDHVNELLHELIVIETNREKAEELRAKGYHVIAGDAGNAETLNEAMIGKAVAIIIAIPDAFEVARVIETVREVKPSIKIVIQDRYDFGATIDMEEIEVDLKVTGSDEIAKRMLSYLREISGK